MGKSDYWRRMQLGPAFKPVYTPVWGDGIYAVCLCDHLKISHKSGGGCERAIVSGQWEYRSILESGVSLLKRCQCNAFSDIAAQGMWGEGI